jgi:hydrogenase maturation protease
VSISVVGIGTPHGDDAVGPAVIERLRSEGLPAGVSAESSGDPLTLVDAAGSRVLVVVDATRTGIAPGTVHEPSPESLQGDRSVSSHGLGVREALSLAAALGRVPEQLWIVGIEALATEGDGLSEPVRAALPEAARRVRALCAAPSGDEAADA